MNELALFAGGGGGLLATKWLLEWRTVAYVESNPYCVKVLKARIRDGYLDNAPIWDDARTFDGTPWRGVVDCITAGFPCQPFSQAGKGLAERDDRNLWPDTIRIVREVKPQWILLENVPRLLSHGYVRRIFGDLAESGYSCRWDCVPASAVGANHQRDRLWIVAYAFNSAGRTNNSIECNLERTNNSIQTKRDQTASRTPIGNKKVAHATSPRCKGTLPTQGQEIQRSESDGPASQPSGPSTEMAHTAIEREWGLSKRRQRQNQEASHSLRDGETLAHTNRQPTQRIAKPRQERNPWHPEPELGRVAHGVAHRVDRLAAIGNGQVPAVAAVVWKLLTEKENATQTHP